MTSFANAFDPSIRAAAPRRPEDRDAVLAKPVRDAGDERAFGADHDEVGVERQRECEQPVGVVGAHRMARGRARRFPGCPARRGAPSGSGLCARRHASACSRAPEPTTKTFTRRVYFRGLTVTESRESVLRGRAWHRPARMVDRVGRDRCAPHRVADRGSRRGRRPDRAHARCPRPRARGARGRGHGLDRRRSATTPRRIASRRRSTRARPTTRATSRSPSRPTEASTPTCSISAPTAGSPA